MRGVNRQAIVNALYHATGIAPSLGVLNSAILVANQKGYKPHWNQYPFSTARARQIMQNNGCQTGSDGICVCQGQKASFRLSTTAGNALRVLAEEIVQAQLKARRLPDQHRQRPGPSALRRAAPGRQLRPGHVRVDGQPGHHGLEQHLRLP